MSPADQRPKLDGRPVWRCESCEIGDEIVVLDAGTATYLSLNCTAATLWGRLDDGAGRAELTAELVSAYDVPPAQVASDVERLVVAPDDLSLLSSNG